MTYEKAMVELVEFENEDVITTSGGTENCPNGVPSTDVEWGGLGCGFLG